jgi:uncharacterized protein DUF4412
VTLAALLLAAATAHPQVYFEQRTVVREGGESPGADVLSRVWYSGKRMRLEAGDAPGGPALLLRLDSGQAFRLDPDRKTARALDSMRLRARAQMDASVANDLMGTGEGARTAALKTPGKTVAGYPCHGYRISAPSLQMDVYVSDAIPLSVDIFADFLEWTGASQALGGLLAEIRRLPGFPMETRSRVTVLGRVQETISTVTKVQIAPQPAALFEIPAGYRIETDTVQED